MMLYFTSLRIVGVTFYAFSHLLPSSIRPKIIRHITSILGVEMSSQKQGCLAGLFGFGRNKNTQSYYEYEEESEDEFPYEAKSYFFTNAEASFYHFLRQMGGENVSIFPHVALRDLVSVSGVEKADFYKYYNQIDRKQVDFLFVNSKTLKPILVIELDDSTHKRADRMKRDTFVDEALAVANIPIVHVPVKQSYDSNELGKLFKAAVQQREKNKNESPDSHFTIDNPPYCPSHGIRMVLRTARQSGEKFWGCPNYPNCREIIRVDNNPS